jgi:hypothetical protein
MPVAPTRQVIYLNKVPAIFAEGRACCHANSHRSGTQHYQTYPVAVMTARPDRSRGSASGLRSVSCHSYFENLTMAQKIRRCANPKCNERLPLKAPPNQECCCETCGRAVRRQRLKDKATAESLFTPSDIVSFDAQLAANQTRDYALSAINMQDIAKKYGFNVVVLPAATGVLVVFPATNQPWPDIMYSDECPWFQVDWRACMFAKHWQVPSDRHSVSNDQDVIDFVNTVQGKDRIRHLDVITDILTGPARRCLLLSLTRLPRSPVSALPRPFWPTSSPGPKEDLDSYGFPMSYSFTLNHETPSERRDRLAAEKTARQIQETIEADFRRKAFATSRREASYARRKYPR